MARDYRKIIAWQLADGLVKELYKATKDFPREELYGLTSQIRRAGVSVAANIVEGASRRTKTEYLHFLYIAKASLSEAGYLVGLSNDLSFLKCNDFKKLDSMYEETSFTLYGLIQAVEREIKK